MTTPLTTASPRPDWPALVLTAGLGTRMHPLSGVRAKPAVPVAGTPLAGRILRWLAAAGVRDAVLNLHHKPETLTRVIGDGGRFGVRVRYSWEPRILGSAGGPARALPLLDAPVFFLINGDTLTDVDLREMARQHVESGAKVTMAVVANPDPRHYGGVEIDDDAVVTRFTRRGPDNQGWHFVGVQAVSAQVFAGLDPEEPAESVGGIYREMMAAQPGSVRVFLSHAPFHDIGTAADYLETSLTFAAREGGAATLAGDDPQVAPDAAVERCVLWDRVRIGAGADLRECVIADDVVVPDGLTLARHALVRRDAVSPRPHDILLGDVLAMPIDALRPKD